MTCLRGIGHDMPIYGMSIREPMRPDGSAGEVLPPGEVGHICFEGPQTFLGYVNDAEATAKTISRDGFLYTGDMGACDESGLHFSGRSKWIIKPAGHQVFPGDVENHFCALEEKVAACAAVGVEHPLRQRGDRRLRGEEARRRSHGPELRGTPRGWLPSCGPCTTSCWSRARCP